MASYTKAASEYKTNGATLRSGRAVQDLRAVHTRDFLQRRGIATVSITAIAASRHRHGERPMRRIPRQIAAIANDAFMKIFEDARREITGAKTVEQVNRIVALATGLAAAARKATDREMEAEAEVLRFEAERQLGQIMQAQREAVGFNVGTRGSRTRGARVSEKPTLAEAGIDKNLAHKARSAAAMTAPEFEAAKENKRKSIITKPKTEPKKKKAAAPVAGSSLADRCVETVRNTIERTIGEMQRGRAPQKKYELLFAALGDVISDLERKTLPLAVDAAAYTATAAESGGAP